MTTLRLVDLPRDVIGHIFACLESRELLAIKASSRWGRSLLTHTIAILWWVERRLQTIFERAAMTNALVEGELGPMAAYWRESSYSQAMIHVVTGMRMAERFSALLHTKVDALTKTYVQRKLFFEVAQQLLDDFEQKLIHLNSKWRARHVLQNLDEED